MRWNLYTALYVLLLVGCTITPPATILSPNATSSPPLIQRASGIAELTPTVSDSSSQITSDEGGKMAGQFLYYRHHQDLVIYYFCTI
jgi:hypothetical protein